MKSLQGISKSLHIPPFGKEQMLSYKDIYPKSSDSEQDLKRFFSYHHSYLGPINPPKVKTFSMNLRPLHVQDQLS